jgi:hypothetical protein
MLKINKIKSFIALFLLLNLSYTLGFAKITENHSEECHEEAEMSCCDMAEENSCEMPENPAKEAKADHDLCACYDSDAVTDAFIPNAQKEKHFGQFLTLLTRISEDNSNHTLEFSHKLQSLTKAVNTKPLFIFNSVLIL